MDPQHSVNADAQPKAKYAAAWLIAAFIIYALTKFPLVMHSPGQMDEQWFAVPGYTMWREGIPRIPYCPTRQRPTFFENADVCLMALPPGLHYVQAPFFALLPAGYPTARMPVFLCGFVLLWVVWLLIRPVCRNTTVAGISLCALALCRPLLFTSIVTRPDLLCCCSGLAALWAMWNWHDRDSWRYLLLAGLLCGIGALFHPFAIVFCLQCGVWALIRRGSLWNRLCHASALTLCVVAVLAVLWLPLIVAHPYEFRSQFFANVLDRSGPGLFSRLIWPWPSLAAHWERQWRFNQAPQFFLLVIGVCVATVVWLLNRPSAEQKRYLLLIWSACYLTPASVGVHPTLGYWLFPIAMCYPLLIDGMWRIGEMVGVVRYRFVLPTMIAVVLGVVLFQGSGVRTLVAYYRHWGDARYHGGNFIASVLSELPKEGKFMVDVSYVFDVYLSGRDTIMCQSKPQYWPDESLDIQFWMITQEGIDGDWVRDYDAKYWKSFGSRDEPQRCFLEMYLPNATAIPTEPIPSEVIDRHPSSQ